MWVGPEVLSLDLGGPFHGEHYELGSPQLGLLPALALSRGFQLRSASFEGVVASVCPMARLSVSADPRATPEAVISPIVARDSMGPESGTAMGMCPPIGQAPRISVTYVSSVFAPPNRAVPSALRAR